MSAYSIASRGLAGRRLPQGTLTPINALLFGSGEQGAWYDPSDLPTLFQDSAGTAPVTAVEQPVGLMLDKSGRGNHTFQATTTKRPIYSRRVNLLVGSTTLATQSITTKAAGYKIVFSGTGSVTLSGTATGVYGAGTNSITCTAGTLTLTVSGSVQEASFHLATDLYLPYQGVNTATDYDADPNKFPAYLACDGIDDAMQTGNIDFTGTNKMTVWAGVTKLSNSDYASLLEHGTTTANADFDVWAPYTGSTYRGDAAQAGGYSALTPALLAPRSDVLSLIGDRASGLVTTLRVAGGVYQSALAVPPGGNYTNQSFYIGGRAGTGNYFNGRIYQLIVRGAKSSQSQIEACELYVKQKMRMP